MAIERLSCTSALLLIAACGGGGGSSTPAPPAAVTVSGTVTFDLVPSLAGAGLDYSATQVEPVRGATVELVTGTTVLAATTTDDNGAYSASVAQNTDLFVRVKAEMTRSGSPSWDFRVVDNTNSDALYALDGVVFSSGTQNSTHDLHAASGWSASLQSYSSPRSAAPFAILDAIGDAVELALTADATLSFPALAVHWSPDNVPSLAASGDPDLASGEIGTSFFEASLGMYLLGAEGIDTDEYDRHVIAHEWGHYLEDSFSRIDSIGGPHAPGDRLDMRVAFSEGWGNAFSAMATGQSVYRDALGPRQESGPHFDVEGPLPPVQINGNPNPGWYSERSMHEILYDLFDANQDTNEDVLALGFTPIYSVLTNQQRDSIALSSIFPFITALKSDLPAFAANIDALVSAQAIDVVADEYGTGETNAGNNPSRPADLLPIYHDISVNGAPVEVCSTDDFTSPISGSENKLGSRRYLRFSVGAAATHTLTATATLVPAGASADPDMVLHRRGSIAVSEDAPGPSCTVATPLNCMETFSMPLTDGDYVLEVYEWTNTAPAGSSAPIGRTCFNVEITEP